MSLRKYYPFIIIAILILALVILWDKYQGQKMTAESRGSIIREQTAEIEYRKTKEGKIIAEKIAAEAQVKDLKTSYPKLVDLITKQMDIRLKDLSSVFEAKFKAVGQGEVRIIEIPARKDSTDSTKILPPQRGFTVADGFLEFNGTIDAEKIQYSYTYTDKITAVISIKKKWFLGKETFVGTATLDNPNAVVTNQTAIQVQQPRTKRWVLSVGASYDPFKNQVRPAIHLGWRVLAF